MREFVFFTQTFGQSLKFSVSHVFFHTYPLSTCVMSCSFGFAFLTITRFFSLLFLKSFINNPKNFSCQNHIKNLYRSRLGDEHIEILMLISMEGPDDDSMDFNREDRCLIRKRTGEFNISLVSQSRGH